VRLNPAARRNFSTMPELAEVEYFRRQWEPGRGGIVRTVELHRIKRIFRGEDLQALEATLTGAKLLGSETLGKQMLFRFSRGGWLGMHLGMTGELRCEPAKFERGNHDHLVLVQKSRALVFRDSRLFGRVRFALGKNPPEWWMRLPPAITSEAFTLDRVRRVLVRHGKAPLKAVLLMQEHFPGIGNWMADEALWQAGLDPRRRAARVSVPEARRLRTKLRHVCREALRTIGVDWSDPPGGWLMHERWGKGGHCPVCGLKLQRAQVGGRTTAWCARCQK